MDFEDVLEAVGPMGPYQISLFLLLSMLSVFGVESIAVNFIAAYMDHWCEVDELTSLPHETQKHVAIPEDEDDPEEFTTCQYYDFNYSMYSMADFLAWNRSQMVTEDTEVVDCQSWVYDQSVFVSTIRSQWDLVCDDTWVLVVSLLCYMLGALIGGAGAGYVADKVGRRLTMWLFILLKVAGNFMATFAPDVIVFSIGRFLIGAGSGGAFIAAFVLVMEVVSATWRAIFGVLFQLAFSVGFMALPGYAYAVRDHVKLQLVLAVPTVIFLTYWWIIPESPRWLLLKGKYKQAEETLQYMADVNNRELPLRLDLEKINRQLNEGELETKRDSFWDVMKSPKLRLWTLVVDFHWFTDSLMYYTLSLNTGALHGDIFINTLISGAVEIPAQLVCMACLNWSVLGRRLTCTWSLVVAGLANFVVIPCIVLDEGTAATALSMVGKAFVTISFSGIYVYTSELFPTPVRSAAMGSAVLAARISGLLAPVMGAPMASVWAPMPFLIFGILGTLSGLLTLLLPETLGHGLPDNMKQAETQLSNDITANHSVTNDVDFKEECCSDDVKTSGTRNHGFDNEERATSPAVDNEKENGVNRTNEFSSGGNTLTENDKNVRTFISDCDDGSGGYTSVTRL